MSQKEYFIDCPNDIGFIHNGRTFTIQTMDIPQAFYSIIGIMAEDSNYHLHSCTFINRCLDIQGYYRVRKSYCRIQFCWGMDNNIVIQTVSMIHQRHGYMTYLYNVLKHIKKIEIVWILRDCLRKFALFSRQCQTEISNGFPLTFIKICIKEIH